LKPITGISEGKKDRHGEQSEMIVNQVLRCHGLGLTGPIVEIRKEPN